jgi:peptide/nickel transport system substrate-binding protein
MNRRTFLRGALSVPMVFLGMGRRTTTTVQAAPGATTVVPKGKMVLAWHAGIASRWLDPQEHDGTASPDNFITILYDALIKNQGKVLYDYLGLTEAFEFGPDATSAIFRLRPGVKFHNGEPVTPADVKFTYEQYRGAKADVLKGMTERLEIVDERTVRLQFTRPFFDFPLIFGTANVCGASWIVPAKYYQQVGPDRFKQQPIGAGPYRLVQHEPGVRLDFEAFPDYHRPVHVKSLSVISVPEDSTRVAMLERGEADIIYLVPGELIDKVRQIPGVVLAPVLSGSWWLQFPGLQDPKNPFHDKRVREAVSLAIDRQIINEAETGGMGKPTGNWINDDVQYALEWPEFKQNVERAKQLMKDAGYPSGFEVDWLTPVPNYFSRGERVISQLREIGIRAKLQAMERGVFLQRMQGGLKQWPGLQIIMNAARIGGSWANWYESMFTCGGFSAKDFFCVKELDDKFAAYQQSSDPSERKRLAEEVQRAILENYYFVPVFRHAFVNAIGPRIAAAQWQDVFQTITTGYAYPWEDIRLKDA